MPPKSLSLVISSLIKPSLFALFLIHIGVAQTTQVGAFSFTLPNGWKRVDENGAEIFSPVTMDETVFLKVRFASVPLQSDVENNEESFKTYVKGVKASNEFVHFDTIVRTNYTCPGKTKFFLIMSRVNAFEEEDTHTFVRSYMGTFTNDALELVMLSINNPDVFNTYGEDLGVLFNNLELTSKIPMLASCPRESISVN